MKSGAAVFLPRVHVRTLLKKPLQEHRVGLVNINRSHEGGVFKFSIAVEQYFGHLKFAGPDCGVETVSVQVTLITLVYFAFRTESETTVIPPRNGS